MFFDFIGRTVGAIFGIFRPQISDGSLNQSHLAIATYGYHIQSQLLHIPDHWGWFSPGPPRLQVAQGAIFALLNVGLSYSYMVFGACLIILMHSQQRSIGVAIGVITALYRASLAFFWVLVCFADHRKPDLVWGDWVVQ
ncbi:hypothetical protein F5Y15DRAFT_54601 [Xylariaceae sp. FL0016]|nr:hypothetical protein F5Y15DRAFT_54601 [Xylariaceae sp. FL0016]